MDAKPAFLIALVLTLLIASNFYLLNSTNSNQRKSVTIQRVIDGDTLVTDSGETLRLENINTPEKGQPGFAEAKNFLTQFETQEIEIETTGLDKYQRTLAKIYTPDYLNLEIVKKGLAKKYLVESSEAGVFAQAEEQAIKDERGLWKKSPYADCISSEIFPKKELIILKNSCTINFMDFTLADESRKSFNFPALYFSNLNVHSKEGETNETDFFLNARQIWNNDKDTLYLFDSDNLLVHHMPYGY